ncbi:MAG: hypothetical protein GY898_00015, partial [Proteobacteria bacterium]|nr:hypothetical protein [Pseudomonadota bacterium]
MNRLTSHRPPHARSHLARRLLFVAALIAAAGGSLLASATPVLAVPLPAPGGAASGPTAADAVGSGDLACDGVAAADAATCHDRYLEDPSGLLPAYRWSDAVDSVPTGDGGGLGEVVIGSIAKLLFAGAAMAWDVTLSIGRYAFVGFSPLADALERGDEVFAAVAGGVVSSGLFLVAFAVTVWGSLRLAARGRLKRSLANIAIHVSALGLVFVLAAGTAVSPMGLAADVDDLVGDLGGHVADLAPDIGNTTWGDPSAAGGSCGLYLSELAATHGHYASLDEGLASSQAGPAVLSGLWSTTFYPTWAQATFGGADAEGSACRWLEAEAGVTASEQYELLVRSGDEGDPSLDFTATWLSP